MKQSLVIALIASLLIVLSHGETISKVSLPTLELRQLEDALESYEHVIVLFQDQEKIEKSQKYMTFMAEVVVEMNERYPNAYIGKFLVQDGHELPQYYKSSEYPAIVFFDKGKKNVYRGALDLENFVRWFSSMTATALINLKDQADFDKFLKSDNYPKLVAMYNDRSVDEIKLIEELVNEDSLKVFDIYKVALCIDDFCNLQYENVVFEKNSLALFRHFDNVEPVALKRRGLDDKLDILEFINKEALPPVVQFDAVNVTKLFAGYSPVQMILFVDPKADNQKVLQDFEASALYNRKEDLYYERVLHSVFQFDEEWEEIKTFFSKYDRSKLPTAFITEVTEDGIIKYEFKKEKVTFDSLREFIDDFRRKDLEKMIISEEVPDNEGKLINKLVGKTFKKEVVLSKENYVVLFCDKLDQQDCQTSMKLFEYVGEKLAEASLLESKNDSSTATAVKLKFGYIDMLKNEVEYRVFTRYPQILLYMKGKKNRPNEFDLPLTPRAFVAWLNTMITELELKLTDTEESTLVEEKYTEKEKEEYEEMKKKLEEQNRIVEEELAKIAAERAEQEQKEKEKAEVKMLEALQDDEDGPRHKLPLGGTIEIDLKPMMAAHAAREEKKAADAAAAAAAASKKAPKKKNEANIDL